MRSEDYYGRHSEPGGAEDTLALFLGICWRLALCVGAVMGVIALCALVIS